MFRLLILRDVHLFGNFMNEKGSFAKKEEAL